MVFVTRLEGNETPSAAKYQEADAEAAVAQTPEICRSPTWRNAEGKRVKESKKKDRETQQSTTLRKDKRLSKKPPAAMDTQRTPRALQREPASSTSLSTLSKSPAPSQSSWEEKRSSISSFTSFLRFPRLSHKRSSSPSTVNNLQRLNAGEAPQLGKLPGIEVHSRQNSLGTIESRRQESDDTAYMREIVGFAVELEEGFAAKSHPVGVARPKSLDPPAPLRNFSRPDTSIPPKKDHDDLTWSTNENGGNEVPELRERSPKRLEQPQQASTNDHNQLVEKPEQAKANKVPPHPTIWKAPTIMSKTEEVFKPRRPPLTPPSPRKLGRTSSGLSLPFDSIGDLHHQRFQLEQSSIAGSAEQLSIDLSNALAEGQDIRPGTNMWPPTPEDSNESLHRDQRRAHTDLGEDRESIEKVSPGDDVYHRFLTQPLTKPGSKRSDESIQAPTIRRVLRANHFTAKTATKPLHVEPKTSTTRYFPIGTHVSNTRGLRGDATPPRSELGSQKPNMVKGSESLGRAGLQSASKHCDYESQPTEHPPVKIATSKVPRPHTVKPKLQRSATTPDLPPLPDTPLVDVLTIKRRSRDLTFGQDSMLVLELDKFHTDSQNREFSDLEKDSSHNTNAIGTVLSSRREMADNDEMIRRSISLKRHQSNPELQAASEPLLNPSLSFLPQLKHQPLTRPKRTTAIKAKFAPLPEEEITPLPSQFPLPVSLSDASSSKSPMDSIAPPQPPFSSPAMRRVGSATPGRLPRLGPAKSTIRGRANETSDDKPMAKMFVICCKCKYWHDLPSHLYEAMALPRNINVTDDIMESAGAKKDRERKGKGKAKEIEGKVFTTVKCPWCEHGMNTACCAGWTAIVYLHKRHH